MIRALRPAALLLLVLALLAPGACSDRAAIDPDGGPAADTGPGADTAPDVAPSDQGASDAAPDVPPADGRADLGDLADLPGDDSDGLPPDASGPRLEVGTGDLAYQEIVAGSNVELTCGPQGGMHIWTSIRLYGYPRTPDDMGNDQVLIDLTLSVTRLDDGMVVGGLTTPYRASFVYPNDPVELIGITNFLNVALSELDGKMLRIDARAVHASGIDRSAASADFVGRVDTAACGLGGTPR